MPIYFIRVAYRAGNAENKTKKKKPEKKYHNKMPSYTIAVVLVRKKVSCYLAGAPPPVGEHKIYIKGRNIKEQNKNK